MCNGTVRGRNRIAASEIGLNMSLVEDCDLSHYDGNLFDLDGTLTAPKLGIARVRVTNTGQ